MSNSKVVMSQAANTLTAPLNVEDVFSTYLYDGTSSALTITNGIDLDGEGGLTWFKCRDVAMNNVLFDTERGDTERLISNNTSASSTQAAGRYPTFTSTGFTLGADTGGDINYTGRDYVSWTFRKAPKFFDVVTYTGDGTTDRTVAHNLGAAPGCIIVKGTDGSETNWWVWHRSVPDDNATRAKVGILNTTNAFGGFTTFSNNADQTDSVFSLFDNGAGSGNESGRGYVAYLFAHNDGDGGFNGGDIIKCGSYTGNGSTDGPEIDLGFEPQWVMTKAVSLTRNWIMGDIMRGVPVGGNGQRLSANTSDAELSADEPFIPQATGFKVRSNSGTVNDNGLEYIYIAIRRGTKVPESGTEVFAVDQGINSSAGDQVFASGFPVDLMIRTDPTTTYNRMTLDRLRGSGKFMNANGTGAESDTAYAGEFDDMTGIFTDTGFNFANHYAWMWKRAPNYFDVVAYEGNSTAGRAVSHNLGVAPEMMWVKARNQNYSWYVYHKDLGATKFLELDGSGAENIGTLWTSTPFTDSAFYLNGAGAVNGSGSDYIAYLFASLAGISKVGSYTGDGTTDGSKIIDCGFTSGARFVLIKKTSSPNGDWEVFDTERGIVAGGDAELQLNEANAQYSGYDQIDPHPSGFAVINTNDQTNASGEDYIFYAIA